MIVAGFGFRHGTGLQSLLALYDQARGDWQIEAVATLDAKADGLQQLAGALNLPLLRVPAADAAAAQTYTRSQASLDRYGTGSVAEAAALCAAGHRARLLVPRVVSRDSLATCALAQGECE